MDQIISEPELESKALDAWSWRQSRTWNLSSFSKIRKEAVNRDMISMWRGILQKTYRFRMDSIWIRAEDAYLVGEIYTL